jgi:hypothetical protein
LGAGDAVLAAARGGVSLYLDALAVALTASGLIRLAAPSSLRRRWSARRTRSFWVTPAFVAAVLSHFASSPVIRTDFGVRVVSGIGVLTVVVVDGGPAFGNHPGGSDAVAAVI